MITSVLASPRFTAPLKFAVTVAFTVSNVPVGAAITWPLEMLTPFTKVVVELTVSVSLEALPIVALPSTVRLPLMSALPVISTPVAVVSNFLILS